MNTKKPHFKLAITKPKLSSTEINWSDAQLMKLKYCQNPDSLKIETNTGVEILNGFRVNAEHLRKLIEGKNENGVVIQNPAQDIYISFGVNLEDVNKPVSQQYFTIIVTAIDSNNVQQTNVVYDNCTPCPDMCPTTL
jgi:predicted amino acid-binding ACT domain protein